MKKSLRKIIAAICMGTMLLSCTAYGADSSQNLMAYTDNVLSDGSLIYYFEEVAVTLPADWQGKIQIETTDNSATFYHKASHEKWQEKYGQEGGKLFTLSCTVNHDFQELPDFTYIGFSDQSVMNYFMIFPTDFQAYTDDSAIAAEFQQMNTEIDYINYVVIGVGINVNLAEIQEELKDKATSLYLETGKTYDRNFLIGLVMGKFEKNYEKFVQTCDLSLMIDDYNMMLANKCQPVRILDKLDPYEGVALGIDREGELLVRVADGRIRKVCSGEVSVRGLYSYV